MPSLQKWFLKKQPGKTSQTNRHEKSKKRHPNAFPIIDSRLRMEQQLMRPLMDGKMDQINAIRNCAQIAERGRSHDSCNPSCGLRQNQQQKTQIKKRQPGIAYRRRNNIQWMIEPP